MGLAVESLTMEPSAAEFLTFQQFVSAHETAVFTFCFRMVGSNTLADCLAAKAFRDAYAHFPCVSLLTVLTSAAVHCRKHLPHDDHAADTAVHDIQQLFNQLTIPEREAMALRYACKLDFTQIAAVLHSSAEAVRVTLRQGRWHVANLEADATP